LIASGQVEDVVVEVEPLENGVAVLARAEVASRVGSLRIDGVSKRLRRRILPYINLRVGQPVRIPRLEADLDRATQYLRDLGYPEATLDPTLAFDLDRATVGVTVAVLLGPPLTVGSLRLEGLQITEAEAWKSTGLEPGQRLSLGQLEEARRELTRRLQREGFWEAEVDPPGLVAGPERGTGGKAHVLVFPVRPGPRYELALEGISRSKGLEKEALGFVRGLEPFSEAGLDEVVRRVRTYLQRAGRLQAGVTARIEALPDRRVLRLVVEEGPKQAIRTVRFPGISSVPDSLLEERVGARTGHPWRWGGEPIDDDTLAADAASVLGTLRENGFAEATVSEPRVVPDGDGVAIELPGSEGQRYAVGELTVVGVPDGITLPTLALVVGGPWSVAAEEQSRLAAEAAIRDAGYIDATVVSARACEAGSCRVAVTVTPGEPTRVGRVVIFGLAKTDAQVVKKVAAIEPGQVAGPEALLAAQRRMLGLGIFQRVAVRPIPGQISGAQRGVLIEVDEAQSRAVTAGVGWDNVEQARLSFSWSELNLFGNARSLFLDTKVSDREKHFQISYREPARLGVLGFPTWVSVFRTDEHYTDYDLLRRGMWIEFGDRRRRPGRILLRYDYQITLPDAPEDILSELEREEQEAQIASITPTFEWDTRDDLFAPTRGYFATFALQEAFEIFQADSPFDKATASVAVFTPLAGGVLAGSLRSGVIHPRDDCEEPCPADNLRLPIAIRFFAGGRITHRAFPTDELGAEGTFDDVGNTIGGASQLIANLEWRFPLFSAVGGSVFVDGGNVWPGWTDADPAELRWGAGLGLRVETPVGPFRVEYGWKLDRLEGESRGEVFVSFGNPF
jgi:outer membrane protein insertion porin family